MTPSSRCLSLGVLLCLALCSACGTTNGSGGAAVAIGVSEKTIDVRWDVDPTSADCAPENLERTCHYLVRGVHITVSFDQQQDRAEQFIADGRPHPHVDMWHFLNSLVPSGSRQLSCRYVAHSSGGGTAHACLYQASRTIIVAYFPHPNESSFGGLVTYDYASYRDIEPEDTR